MSGREHEAQRREVTDTTLAGPGPEPAVAPARVGLEDPVALAERWAAAQQPGVAVGDRVELDKRVRAKHAATAASSPEAKPTGGTAATVQHQGVWQDGSPEIAKAGLSYTRRPGSTITAGLTPTAATAASGDDRGPDPRPRQVERTVRFTGTARHPARFRVT